jgi:type VI secretion system protein ImpH
MEGAMRESPDRVAFFRRMADEPFKFDFYQTLRRMECFHAGMPRLGTGMRPVDEPIRLAQEPSMSFAPATLSAFAPANANRPARLDVRFFGLLGPNGPLPLHLTEHARDRLYHANDPTFVRFLDILHHRFLLLFYRAWAQAQPSVSLDRPKDDRFSIYIGSLIGLAGQKVQRRDKILDFAKLHFSGLLSRQARNRDGLAALLAAYFDVRSQVEEFVGHWMQLPAGDLTRLGGMNQGAQVGIGAVLGARMWDRQSKIRVQLGPMTLAQYESFLPGGLAAERLVHWLKQYLGLELEWDVRLVLKRDEVPPLRPGRYGRLGWTTWLGTKAHTAHPNKLILNAERLTNMQAA